jgi:hypothetical protein
MLTIKADRRTRTIRLPIISRDLLSHGDNFIFSQSGDTIILKQVQETPWPAETNVRTKQKSLEEIDEIVHIVRKKTTSQER